MTAFLAWGAMTLIASSALMLLVLAIRTPARHFVGPRLAYWLWGLPAARMIMPPLPFNWSVALWTGQTSNIDMQILFVGPLRPLSAPAASALPSAGMALFGIWLLGAISLVGIQAGRHFLFCSRLRREGVEFGSAGAARIVAAEVRGPLAFGVVSRVIAVPRAFSTDYSAVERDLVLAHEIAHHVRGDLLFNWASLFVLAAHWWNPCAWIAIRAFREDQEFAADAHVLAAKGPTALFVYASVLAKAAGIGALPASNLNTRSNLKGRLIMLRQKPKSRRHLALGGLSLALLGGAALAATSGTSGSTSGKQAVTIGVKPDGAGGFALIVDGLKVMPGTSLPNGSSLPADFSHAGGCDLAPTAKPFAMVIKGTRGAQTYTIMCASAGATPVRVSLTEGLSSLKAMRASVAVQESPSFPISERVHALAAIDRSIHEVEATLAHKG